MSRTGKSWTTDEDHKLDTEFDSWLAEQAHLQKRDPQEIVVRLNKLYPIDELGELKKNIRKQNNLRKRLLTLAKQRQTENDPSKLKELNTQITALKKELMDEMEDD